MINCQPLDPNTLHGVSFIDKSSRRKMRYIYPDSGHWTAGWIVAQNPSGEWMTWRKATSEDLAAIREAVAIHTEREICARIADSHDAWYVANDIRSRNVDAEDTIVLAVPE